MSCSTCCLKWNSPCYSAGHIDQDFKEGEKEHVLLHGAGRTAGLKVADLLSQFPVLSRRGIEKFQLPPCVLSEWGDALRKQEPGILGNALAYLSQKQASIPSPEDLLKRT